MQGRRRKPQFSLRPASGNANVTSAVGMEESIGRSRARRTSLYTRTVMWLTGLICTAFLLGTLAQAWSNSQLMAQVQQEQQSLSQISKEHEQLKKTDAYYSDPAVIESEARQQLGYIRPGEQSIVIVDANNKGQPKIQQPEKKPVSQDYWQAWWQVFFGSNVHR